jgi:superfamily II DNA helicase RecQ
VWHWGESFRTQYSQLIVLRSIIPHNVPWLACSATLDAVTLAKVQELCGFSSDVLIQRHSIDRPDIFLGLRQLAHPAVTFRDLHFLLEPAKKSIEDQLRHVAEKDAREALCLYGAAAAAEVISSSIRDPPSTTDMDSRAACWKIQKTVVYFDSILAIEAATALLTAALVQLGCSKTAASNAIQPYHSELATFDKVSISSQFKKPDKGTAAQSSRHRIILATDAMGMGIDNPDIKLVIQWRIPPSLSALWQRAGRAARGPNTKGEFLWLIDSWCISPAEDSRHITDEKRRQSMPKELYDVIHSPTCIRLSILLFFGEDLLKPSSLSAHCCTVCRGDTIVSDTVLKDTVQSQTSQKHIQKAAEAALKQWRKHTSSGKSSTTITRRKEDFILPMAALMKMSRTASFIQDVETLRLVAGQLWASCDRYASEVVEVLKRACLDAVAAKQAQYPPQKRALKRHALAEISPNVRLPSSSLFKRNKGVDSKDREHGSTSPVYTSGS